MARRHHSKQRDIAANARGDSSSAGRAVQTPAQPTDHLRHALLGAAAALLVARPLVPSDGGAWVGDGQIAAALWIALAGLWLVQSLGRPRLQIRFGWIDAATIAFAGWWSLSSLMGAAHAAPRPSINMLWEGVATLLAFLLLRQLIGSDGRADSGREARALVAVMITVGVVLSITAIYQYTVTLPATRQRFVEHPEAMFREAQIPVPARGTQEFRRFADRLNSPEPVATFNLTNSLAAYLAPWLVIAMGLAMLGWRRPHSQAPSWRDRLGPVACAALIAIALALTRSRSAWIGAGVGLLWIMIWRLSANRRAAIVSAAASGKPPRRLRAGRLAAMFAAIAVVLAGTTLAVRPHLLEPAVRSFQVRLDYWRSTCRMIADRPWLGVGPGNFAAYYTQHKVASATEEVLDPHNFALEIAASAGLPAIVLFLAMLAGFAVRLWRRGRGAEAADGALHQSAASAMPLTGDAAAIDPPADGSWWILGGAIAGMWLALLWNVIVGFPASEEQAAVWMAVAGIAWWLMWPWIDHGRLSPRMCGIGVLVLLVTLLAVGGITFGGVNETLWLLLALGLNSTERTRAAASVGESIETAAERNIAEKNITEKRSLPWLVNLPLLGVVLVLWFAQHQSGYEPMLGCQAALDAARAFAERGEEPRQEQQLLLAAEADPYAVEPREKLASLRLLQWLRGDKNAQRSSQFTNRLIGDFENWIDRAILLDPQSASLRAQAGSGWRLIFEITKLPADGRKAVERCRQAAELYPTGVIVQFELAQSLSALANLPSPDPTVGESGLADAAAAKAAAREALRLDDLRPEAERAMNPEQRKLAERIISGDNRPPAVRLGPPLPP